MSNFISIGSVQSYPSGTIKTVVALGKKIAVACVDGEYFAIDDTCSHEECSLGSDGFLDGTIVVCGCHGSSFDMTNGKVLSLPAPCDVNSYEVKVERGELFIKL